MTKEKLGEYFLICTYNDDTLVINFPINMGKFCGPKSSFLSMTTHIVLNEEENKKKTIEKKSKLH